jgi:hypothetical protein
MLKAKANLWGKLTNKPRSAAMTDEWELVKKRRNSGWRSVVQSDMSEADARAMAANMNKVEADIRYFYVAEKITTDPQSS